MISSLKGIVSKQETPFLTIDVAGVGYEVQCTAGLWEVAKEGGELSVDVYTFVREDRLELFGFSSHNERKLFVQCLSIPGVGPRMALQICSTPMSVLAHAVENQDTRALSTLKGVGKKMAEKLLVELESLAEKGLLVVTAGDNAELPAEVDHDALEALVNLGYDRRSMLTQLKGVSGAKTTEERVKRVLQAL